MSETARKLATYADISHLPEGENVEIIAGEIIVSPRSKPAHGLAQAALSWSVAGPFGFRDDPGGWWIVVEVEVELGRHDVYIPDLAGWRRARVPIFPDDRPVTVVPDWVCEVLSPSTGRIDRVKKAHGYLEGGVPFFWIVDLEGRVLEAFEARDGSWVRLGAWGDGDSARIPPFDAVEIAISPLFPPPPPENP
jgi:Uma2 family endonuclease